MEVFWNQSDAYTPYTGYAPMYTDYAWKPAVEYTDYAREGTPDMRGRLAEFT